MSRMPATVPSRHSLGHGGLPLAAATVGLLALVIAVPASGAPQATVLEARLYQRGDAVVLEAYGEPLCVGGRSAEYDVEVASAGNYLLAIRYAAAESRAARLLVDGLLVHDQAVAGTTGSWVAATGKWEDQAILHLSAGRHTLRVERDPCLPHLTALRLTPTEAPARLPLLAGRQAALQQTIAEIRGALEKLGGASPAAPGLLQQAAALSTAVQRADLGNAPAEAARAMDELEGRGHALRLPVAALRTEALAGRRDRLVAWAGDPQVKVSRDSLLPEACATSGLRLEACRNTYEAAVVCVSSFDYSGPLRVAVTPLTPRGGGRALTATARFVGYVRSERNTPGRPDRLRPAPAEYPDPLLLDPEVSVQPRSTQPVWVTVRVPAEARPGEYLGALTLGTAGAPPAPFPIRLRVLRPVLPNTPSFRMGSWGGDTFLAAAAAGKPRDNKTYDDAYFAFLENECLRDRYEHRALVFSDAPLWSVFSACRTVWRDNAYAFDTSLFDRFVSTVRRALGSEFRIICVGLAAGTSQDRTQLLSGEIHAINPDGSANAERSFANTPTDDPAYQAFLGEFCRAMERHLREQGWLEHVYFKVLDEITGETLPAALRLRAHIKACAPQLRLDETILDGKVLGQEHVDLPIVNTCVAPGKTAQIAALAAAGQEVWTYNNFLNMMDLPAIHTSIMGWVSYLHGVGGYMHWAWAWRVEDARETPYTEPYGPGADFLVYLDRDRKRVVDSIRWELLRQTSQDYEMLHMLQQRGGDSKALCRQLVRGFTDYETDPARFARARHRLMAELDRR